MPSLDVSPTPVTTPRPAGLSRFLIWLSRSRIVVCLLFVVLGVMIYSPALGGGIIWDDIYLVGDNPFFRSPVFGLEVFRHYLFFESFSIYYRPVQNWSYMLDYWLWRGDLAGYHFTNILLHAGCAYLLYELLSRLMRPLGRADEEAPKRSLVAFAVAIIWLVHPIHNAAVAYISGRADSLAMLFTLSAWIASWHAVRTKLVWRRWALAGWAGLSLLLGLCSKEIALVWLGLFVVHLFAVEREISWKAKAALLGGILTCFLGYYALHALPEPRAGTAIAARAWPERILMMLRALGDYTTLIFWPGNLHMERTVSPPSGVTGLAAWREYAHFELLGILGFLVIVAAVWLCRSRRPGWQLRCAGAAWFAIAFLPISNLFPLNAEVAEHWIYVASIGYLIFLAGCFLALPARFQTIVGALLVLGFAGLGVRTAVRAADWVDAVTFYERTIAAGGRTARLMNSLAAAYGMVGDLPKQEAVLRDALQRYPAYAPLRILLGVCLNRQNREAEAAAIMAPVREHSEEYAKLFPRTWPVILDTARGHRNAKRADEALKVLAEGRERFPKTWELVNYTAAVAQEFGRVPEILPVVENYAAAHWWHRDAWLVLAKLRASQGLLPEAAAAFRHTARLDIYDPRPYLLLAEMELQRDQPEAALEAQQEAIRRTPGQPSQYLALAHILQKLGRTEEAQAATRKSQEFAAAAREK